MFSADFRLVLSFLDRFQAVLGSDFNFYVDFVVRIGYFSIFWAVSSSGGRFGMWVILVRV